MTEKQQQVRIKKSDQKAKPSPKPALDLRTPSGKPLPF